MTLSFILESALTLLLAATLVAPGHNRVLPLMPEFITPQDGAEKQDCERNAAKRWLAAHGERMKPLRPIFLGDDLFACQPICQPILDGEDDFLFTAKPDSHKALYDFMNGAEIEEMSVTRKEGGKKLTYRYRWFKGAPLREGKDALSVDWIGLTIFDAKGKPTAKARALAPAIREVLQEAVEAGGSTLRDHRQPAGELGYFQHSFQVYDREGEECQTAGCGGIVKRFTQNGRSTFWCPKCQK